jgi:hypothetical protein
MKNQGYENWKMRRWCKGHPGVRMCAGTSAGPVIAKPHVNQYLYPGAQWRGGLRTSIGAPLCDDGSEQASEYEGTLTLPDLVVGEEAATSSIVRFTREFACLARKRRKPGGHGLTFLEPFFHFEFSSLSSLADRRR